MGNREHELDAGPADACPVGAVLTIPHRHFRIAVFHRPEGWFAIKDPCPHAGDSLSRGTVDACVVTCPGHNWQFRLDTGACVRGKAEHAARTYPVEIRDGHVWVKLA